VQGVGNQLKEQKPKCPPRSGGGIGFCSFNNGCPRLAFFVHSMGGAKLAWVSSDYAECRKHMLTIRQDCECPNADLGSKREMLSGFHIASWAYLVDGGFA